MFKTDVEKTGKIIKTMLPEFIYISIHPGINIDDFTSDLKNDNYSIVKTIPDRAKLKSIVQTRLKYGKVVLCGDLKPSELSIFETEYTHLFCYPKSQKRYHEILHGTITETKEKFAKIQQSYEEHIAENDRIFVILF